MISIETVVEKVKLGETDYFEVIIEEFQQQLFYYSYHLLGNTHEAEDAVQESFIKAFEKIHLYTNKVSFSAWLYKITHNHCINLLRRKKLISFIPLLSDKEIPQFNGKDQFDQNELSKPLLDALSKISITDKSIVLLRVFKEKSFDEISSILDLNTATVRKKYERARKKLQLLLTDAQKGGSIHEGYSFRG